ncbi:MAG: hypothetical protein ACKV0T_10915 [Planctomycetales bacterium]
MILYSVRNGPRTVSQVSSGALRNGAALVVFIAEVQAGERQFDRLRR